MKKELYKPFCLEIISLSNDIVTASDGGQSGGGNGSSNNLGWDWF